VTLAPDRLLRRLPDYERTGHPPAPTLERVAAIAAKLGNPQRAFESIHVTGTNGKGSTVAMIAALLTATGCRVGTYTSPHVRDVTERIAVDGRPVGALELEWALAEVCDVAERYGIAPSWFEAMTLAGYLMLAEAQVDVAAVEVGMLGRWDATNIIDARVAVVTNVELDHTDFAGPRLSDIAREKAGIVRTGAPLILGDMDPCLRAVFEAEGPGSVLQLGRELGSLPELPALRGRHQRANAALARAAVEAYLGAPLDDGLVCSALAEVHLPGRFEVIDGAPDVVLDGAHNAAAAAALRATLDEAYPRGCPRVLVCGALTGRDLAAFLRALGLAEGAFDAVVMTAPPSPRALPPSAAAGIAADLLGAPVRAAADVRTALEIAADLAGDDGVVLVTGSLYLIDPARSYLEVPCPPW
jgi:dihydrofolate synthase/folylpolyglutamate synthase